MKWFYLWRYRRNYTKVLNYIHFRGHVRLNQEQFLGQIDARIAAYQNRAQKWLARTHTTGDRFI